MPVADSTEETAQPHTIPAFDRMTEIPAQLERRDDGANIRNLTLTLQLPRTAI